MRKLVLGIVAVLVLDVAFIWMMAFETEVPEIAHSVSPDAEKPMLRESSPVGPSLAYESEEPQDRGPRHPAPARWSEPSKSAASAKSQIRKADDGRAAVPSLDAKRLFPDKIIYYGKYETPEATASSAKAASAGDIVEPEVEQPDAPIKRRKRSFKSRAFGVIKKPYNVIKKPFKWIGSAVVKVVR